MKTSNSGSFKNLGLAVLFLALGLNTSCGKSEFQVDDAAQAQETGNNTVNTDVDGVTDGNSTTTNTNCTQSNGTYNNNGTYTNGTFNPNCSQTVNTGCQQSTLQNCNTFPTNQRFEIAPTTFRTNNVFVQQVPMVQEIFVSEVYGAPIVQFAAPIVYNSVQYEVVPAACSLGANTFTTVYQSQTGNVIRVQGNVVNNQIRARVIYPQANSLQTSQTTVYYNLR